MNERHERRSFRITERESRHALLGSAISDDRADLVAVNVVCNHFGTRQIRPGFTPARIPAVAECAALQKKRLSILNLNRRICLRLRLLVLAHSAWGLDGGLRALRGTYARTSHEKGNKRSFQLCTFRINRGMLAARSSGVARTKSPVELAGGFFAFGSTLTSLIFSSIARF